MLSYKNLIESINFTRNLSNVKNQLCVGNVLTTMWYINFDFETSIFFFFIKILRLKNVDWFYFLPEIKRGTHPNISKKSPLYFRCWGVVITFPTKSWQFLKNFLRRLNNLLNWKIPKNTNCWTRSEVIWASPPLGPLLQTLYNYVFGLDAVQKTKKTEQNVNELSGALRKCSF